MPKLAQLDLRGQPRPDPAAIGALEAGTDVSSWQPFPEAPGDVTVDWAAGVVPIQPGVNLSASDVDVTVAAPGVPALTAGDVTVKIQKMDGATVLAEADSFLGVAGGESYRPIGRYSHPVLSLRSRTGATALVESPFTPEIVANQGTATWRSDGLAALTGTYHLAMRVKRIDATIAGGTRLINTVDFRIDIGGNGEFVFRYSPGASNAPFNETLFTLAQNETVSVLFSAFKGNNGGLGTTVSAEWKIDSAANQTLTSTTDVGDFGGTGGDNYFFGRTDAVDIMNVEFEEYFGVWEGGTPAWSDFFETDGSVKQWASDPTRGVAGMSAALLIAGVSGFNDPLNQNLGTWPGATGNLRAAGALAFTQI